MATFKKSDFNALSIEQLTEMMQLCALFLTAQGARCGISLVVVDDSGVKTMGNLTQEMQRDVFAMLADTMSGPDDVKEIDLEMPGGVTSATH